MGLALLLASCGGETDDPAPDCTVSDLAVTLTSKSNDLCGQQEGELVFSASRGAGDYEFSLDGTTFQTGGTFSGLAAGSYTVTVKDANDCMKTLEASIADDGGVSFEVASTNSACGTSTGTVTVDASGVDGAEIRLDDGAFGTASTFTAVSSGKHTVTVRDDAGCEETREVSVLSGISYQADIAPIIAASCSISGCHNGTQVDFRVFSNVKDHAAQIKTRTANKSMPQTGSLTEEEIQAIACWVDDGALDN